MKRNFSRLLRDAATAAAFLACFWLIALKLQSGSDVTVNGPYWVVDGDTLSVQGKRLRLLGLDAPELSQTCRRDGEDWPCGLAARDALRVLVMTHAIVCRGRDRDRYGRLLVGCSDGEVDAAAAMVAQGLAVSLAGYEREERAARAARTGLWAGEFVDPADWRRQKGMAADLPVGSFLGRLKAGIGLD